MKLRQKFAAFMAAAMVVTAVPVVTMAASTNTMTTPVKVVPVNTKENNESFKRAEDSNALQIKFTDNNVQAEEVFYVTLENAEWHEQDLANALKATLNDNTIEFEYSDEKGNLEDSFVTTDKGVKLAVKGSLEFEDEYTIKVILEKLPEANGKTTLKDDVMVLPLLAGEIAGEAKVKVSTHGSGSTVSEGTYVFATTAEKKINFTVGDMTTVYEKGTIADISFSEVFKGSSVGQTAEIEFELKDADYEFDLPVTGPVYAQFNAQQYNDYVKLAQGYAGKTLGDDIKVSYMIESSDKGVCTFKIEVKNGLVVDSIGKLTLQDLPVVNDEKEITTGELLMDIVNANDTDLLANAATNVKVADVVAYSDYITMKDSKPVDVVAGRTEKIEFVVGENIADSFVAGREIEITLDNNAHFNYPINTTFPINVPNSVLKDCTTIDGNTKIVDSIKVGDHNNTIIVTLNEKINQLETKDKFKLELEVCVPVSAKEDEKITITASGRGLEEKEVSTTAINVVNPFNVTMEPLNVKVGLQNQVGGKITIEETEKEMFMKGNIRLLVVDPTTDRVVDGITFYDKDFVEFSTTGDIKKADIDAVFENGEAVINIKRQSASASTLELKDFHVTVDRSVPEGKYDLILIGTAIDEHGATRVINPATGRVLRDANGYAVTTPAMKNKEQVQAHQIRIKDFLVVGTPNTEDIAVNGLAKGTVEFTVGESKYEVNGKTVEMDAASYIQDPGYTMVPVRYVAEAFGIDSKDILFSNSTVTIITGSRTVQLRNNSDVAIVNGAQVKMGTKVVIKDGRTYAPIGEVARILGVKTGWDNTTKTATFTN